MHPYTTLGIRGTDMPLKVGCVGVVARCWSLSLQLCGSFVLQAVVSVPVVLCREHMDTQKHIVNTHFTQTVAKMVHIRTDDKNLIGSASLPSVCVVV